MRRISDECGATAVLVALLMVPLIGFAAITIDVGALYVERRQLQNGADAAALAIAQDCRDGVCDADPADTAAGLADANANDDNAFAKIVAFESVPDSGAGSVTVQTSTETDDGSTGLAHFFAPILGVDSTEVAATASAVWGAPVGGPTFFPFVISSCEFDKGFDVLLTIKLMSDDNKCEGPYGGNEVPGGFGWVPSSADGCGSNPIAVEQDVVGSDPGASMPAGCTALLEGLQGKTLLFPIYGAASGTGSGATYTIYGFAAFRITGWKLPSSNHPDPAAGSCSNKCVQGMFEEFVALDDAYEYGTAPDLGASVIKLTLENGS